MAYVISDDCIACGTCIDECPVEEKPAFHVAAPVGWINDPNGFSWYQGQIHLFY